MERILFDNYDLDYDYEEIKQYMLDCGYEKEEITKQLMYEFWCSDNELRFESLFAELNNLFDGETIICFGNIGRWNGYFDAGKIFDDFEKAWYDMTKDCEYVRITDDNGRLFVRCSHHDGTNNFQIKVLTDKGKDYYDNWNYGSWIGDARNEQYVHNQIIKRYSHNPNAFKRMYC